MNLLYLNLPDQVFLWKKPAPYLNGTEPLENKVNGVIWVASNSPVSKFGWLN